MKRVIVTGIAAAVATLATTFTPAQAGGWGHGPSWKQGKKDAKKVGVAVVNVISTAIAGGAGSGGRNTSAPCKSDQCTIEETENPPPKSTMHRPEYPVHRSPPGSSMNWPSNPASDLPHPSESGYPRTPTPVPGR